MIQHYATCRSDQQRALESVVIGAVARTVAVVTLIPMTVLKTRYEVGSFWSRMIKCRNWFKCQCIFFICQGKFANLTWHLYLFSEWFIWLQKYSKRTCPHVPNRRLEGWVFYLLIFFHILNIKWRNSLLSIYCLFMCVMLIAALFSGMAPTLVRDVPFSGIYLMFYTKFKKMVNESRFTIFHRYFI